jgi:hypothetical protein
MIPTASTTKQVFASRVTDRQKLLAPLDDLMRKGSLVAACDR